MAATTAAATARDNALQAAVSQIEKQFGKGSVLRMGSSEVQPISTISTGSLALDTAIGVGGVPRGRVVEIYGPESSGKTTSALLVPRIHEVVLGRVLVDGRDVRDLTLDSLRDTVGMVMQDPHLFHDTIAANLRYARPDATDGELVEACRDARIHDLIESLPDGYATVVGERGYRMSGGEKQRLAIARMLLKDPAIVILDEATSHLDAESELAIQRALADALAGRTALVIAHRLSTIVAADRILVLEDGRIAEEGRHEDLLDAGGLYADLYRTQLHQAPESV